MSFLSSLSTIHGLGACNLILYIHFFYQFTATTTVYPLTSIAWSYRGLRYRPIELGCFFWSYPVTSCYFSNDCRLKLIFLKCIWNSCLREWKLLSLYVFCRIIFISLIVSSPSRNCYSCAAYFQSYINIACRSVAKNAVRQNITRFKDYT